MENRTIGSFYGEGGFLHLEIENGMPLMRVHGKNEELMGKLSFVDACMLDNLIVQLEYLKRALFLKKKGKL